MYPDEFDYYAPETVEGALDLMSEHGGFGTELLAGGHSLLPTMKTGFSSPETVIDIGDIDELHGIEHGGDHVSVGALTTYNEIVDADTFDGRARVLQRAAGEIGDEQVRNRGTVGGNLAHADPAADLPGAAIAAGAEIVAQGPDGEVTYDIDDFFMGMYATALGGDELVTEIRLPTGGDTVTGYEKKPSPSSGYVMVSVAAALEMDGEEIENAHVAANGVLDHAVRLDGVEQRLEGQTLDERTADEASEHATEGFDIDQFMDDLQASSEFRANLLEVYTRRTLEQAGSQSPA